MIMSAYLETMVRSCTTGHRTAIIYVDALINQSLHGDDKQLAKTVDSGKMSSTFILSYSLLKMCTI